MSHTTVTVVIPCHNHGRFVADAVRSCLAQTHGPVDVVVVDDGSDDASADACRRCESPRVRVVRQDHQGLPAARNLGARHARGQFLVFLDADDWLEPVFVERLAHALRREHDAGRDASHAYCQERLVELGQGVWRVPAWDPLLMMITNIHPVTCLIRRDCFDAVGGFDESLREGYEDWDLWLRFIERGWHGVRVPEPLFVWRRHSPRTMVMQAVEHHERLYRQLVERHASLYARHAQQLIVRMSTMLRRFDVNWLDESGEPISLLYLRAQLERLKHARQQADDARRRADRIRNGYETMTAIRLQRRVDRLLARLPGPLGRSFRTGLVRVARALAGPHPSQTADRPRAARPDPPPSP